MTTRSDLDLVKCPHCGKESAVVADNVSIHGMYDCHLFHRVTGRTVGEVIDNWLQHNREKHPVTFEGGREVDDIGKSSLCPAIVMSGKKELRRVGRMVFPGGTEPDGLMRYRDALLADPDIPRLLASLPATRAEP